MLLLNPVCSGRQGVMTLQLVSACAGAAPATSATADATSTAASRCTSERFMRVPPFRGPAERQPSDMRGSKTHTRSCRASHSSLGTGCFVWAGRHRHARGAESRVGAGRRAAPLGPHLTVAAAETAGFSPESRSAFRPRMSGIRLPCSVSSPKDPLPASYERRGRGSTVKFGLVRRVVRPAAPFAVSTTSIR